MTISGGDKLITLTSRDGMQLPYSSITGLSAGDKFILARTMDGRLVPVEPNTIVGNAENSFMALTADGHLTPFGTALRWVPITDYKKVDTFDTPSESIAHIAEERHDGYRSEFYANLSPSVSANKSNMLKTGKLLFEASMPVSTTTQQTISLTKSELNIYSISAPVDMASLTWSNKPSGTLITTFTSDGSWDNKIPFGGFLNTATHAYLEDLSTTQKEWIVEIYDFSLASKAIRIAIENTTVTMDVADNWDATLSDATGVVAYQLNKEI